MWVGIHFTAKFDQESFQKGYLRSSGQMVDKNG